MIVKEIHPVAANPGRHPHALRDPSLVYVAALVLGVRDGPTLAEVQAWCGENLRTYRFSHSKSSLYLGATDAVFFKLRWYDGAHA